MTAHTNPLLDVIFAAGGYAKFAKAMGTTTNSAVLQAIAAGKRIPSERLRAAIVKASKGKLTEQDVIALSGRAEYERKYSEVDSHWDLPEDERRQWIAEKAAQGAAATLRGKLK